MQKLAKSSRYVCKQKILMIYINNLYPYNWDMLNLIGEFEKLYKQKLYGLQVFIEIMHLNVKKYSSIWYLFAYPVDLNTSRHYLGLESTKFSEVDLGIFVHSNWRSCRSSAFEDYIHAPSCLPMCFQRCWIEFKLGDWLDQPKMQIFIAVNQFVSTLKVCLGSLFFETSINESSFLRA